MTTQELINQEFNSLKALLISQIHAKNYGVGLAPFVHNPDDEDGTTCRVNFIDNEGWVNIDTNWGGTESYHLKSLWIDELLTIYNMQCASFADARINN